MNIYTSIIILLQCLAATLAQTPARTLGANERNPLFPQQLEPSIFNPDGSLKSDRQRGVVDTNQNMNSMNNPFGASNMNQQFGQGFNTDPFGRNQYPNNQFGQQFGAMNNNYNNMGYPIQNQLGGSQFYCYQCASPRKHGRPELLAAMDQLFNLRYSSCVHNTTFLCNNISRYPYDAVHEYCDKPVDFSSMRRQACQHPYCYAIRFGDASKGELMLTVRGCAEHFMAVNPGQLEAQMGVAGTCRALPSNHQLPVKECVCKKPFCDDLSRGTASSIVFSHIHLLTSLITCVLMYLRIA